MPIMNPGEISLRTWPDFYDPELYDLEVGLGRRVSAAYVSLLAGLQSPVLELGCGTGEIVVALARAGHGVTGVDISEPMLEVAARRLAGLPADARDRARLEVGDMKDFRLGNTFGAALLANDMVNHALEVEDLLAVLRACRRHLEPEGRLLFDVLDLDVHQLSGAAGPNRGLRREIGIFPTASTGESIRVSENTHFDPETWIRESVFTYEHLSSRGRVTAVDLRRLIQRPWTPTELLLALRLAHFVRPRIFVDKDFPGRFFCEATAGPDGEGPAPEERIR